MATATAATIHSCAEDVGHAEDAVAVAVRVGDAVALAAVAVMVDDDVERQSDRT